MDFSQKLTLSFYKTIATLNPEHHIFLVQHQDTHEIYVKKILDIYNIEIYENLFRHPILGIPRIIEYCQCENQLIVIEEYICGQSLEKILNTSHLELSDVFRYTLELCNILQRLHNHIPPMIHRDIKPSNIMITPHNHVVLIDFNAAKFFSSSTGTDTILLGTKGYAAPEQYGFGASTPQTDIYALGVLLQEMTKPFPKIPKKLKNLIQKCVKINPQERYHKISEITKVLGTLTPISKGNDNVFSTPSETEAPSHCKFLPPGFRTRTPWKMLVAIPYYLLIFYMSLTLESQNSSGIELWISRFFCLSIFLSMVFTTCNYLNIQSHFPLCNSPKPEIKFLGILLINFILLFDITLIFVILLFLLSM